MLSTIATAALINFLILPVTYHESEPAYTKNKIENYDVITISQSGSLFYSVTNQIIESARNLESNLTFIGSCLLYTSPSPRDAQLSRMPSSA